MLGCKILLAAKKPIAWFSIDGAIDFVRLGCWDASLGPRRGVDELLEEVSDADPRVDSFFAFFSPFFCESSWYRLCALLITALL